MDACCDGAIFVSDRTIDSHIRNIRAKFRMVDNEADLIGTVQGLGTNWRSDASIFSKILGLLVALNTALWLLLFISDDFVPNQVESSMIN